MQTDFTKFPRAVAAVRAADADPAAPFDTAALDRDGRHLRRRVVELAGGDKVLADLPQPVVLVQGDRLILEDGRQVGIVAADEEVLAVRGRDQAHLTELAWHAGNRHVPLAAGPDHILVPRDAAARAMLEELGATVSEAMAPFEPLHNTHSGHDHGHGHDHDHGHHHHGHGDDEHHGERDAHGRLPGDPHYGHNHA